MENWRIFCAVELPERVRARVADHAAVLRRAAPEANARWERAEKLHLTLKFLGETSPERIPDLSNAARRATEATPPFSLVIEGTGAFPPRGSPRVLWLGVRDESGNLSLLHRRLEDECAAENFPREARAFRPHLTVARLRGPEGARALAETHRATSFAAEAFGVTEIVVMRSELGPGGSRYTALSRHRLAERG